MSDLMLQATTTTSSSLDTSFLDVPRFEMSPVVNLQVTELENASLDGYLDRIVDQVSKETCERGWTRSVNEKMVEARMGTVKLWRNKKEKLPEHTTKQSLITAEVTTSFYEELSRPLSGFGKRMLMESIQSAPLSSEEKLIRQNAVFELAASPKHIADIHSFAKELEIFCETNQSIEKRKIALEKLKGSAEGLTNGIKDPLIQNLVEKVRSYFTQEILTDFISLDLSAEFVPNRFAKNPTAQVRLSPINVGETLNAAWMSGLIGGLLNLVVHGLSAESGITSAFATNFSWVTGSLWSVVAAMAGIETWYQAQVDKLFSAYHEGLYQTKEFDQMVGAVAALEELASLGRLAACPGAKKSNEPSSDGLMSLSNLEDPLAKLKGHKTVPVSLSMSPKKPLLLNGQNGGGKTYICGVLIRNLTSDAIGGPVFADDPEVPLFAFWAMQSPKQESNGNQGRLGSEADTSSYLLERAEEADGPALLIYDEVGQGTSREGTEDATKRVLGEAAATEIFTLHPSHELPLTRRLYQLGLVDAMQVINSGEKVSHGFIPGVAKSSGAHLIAKKVGYSPKQTEKRVIKAGGDVELFRQWAKAGEELSDL